MAEIYDTDRFGELYYSSRQPTTDHLLLAARYLTEICQQSAIPCAFLGGWTIRLRGGSRETQDVDITVSTTMERFKQTVLQMPRICFPQVHGQTAVNLFVHTGMSYDQDYKDLPNLAVQVDVIISGQLNSPATIDDNTSEILPLANGFSARIVNTYHLLRGKFHAHMMRGQSNTNDYQDLVFLITKYPTHMAQHSSDIDKAHRLAFFQKYAEMNAGNAGFVKWMERTLGLEKADDLHQEDEETEEQKTLGTGTSTSDWVWDETHGRYRKLVDGNWQWAPVEQQAPQPEASSPDWVWDATYGRYRTLVNGNWQWAST